MTVLRVPLRLIFMMLILLAGLLIELAIFPMLTVQSREKCIRQWSRLVLAALGVSVQVSGPAPTQACQIAANHSSWLDIFVINSVCPAQFVAKSEVREWPLIGLLAARAGTHFIERGRRRAVHTVLQALVRSLKQGRVVAVFPEGTTNDGTCLMPFHANLLQAALDAGLPVRPLGIRYVNSAGTLSEALRYVGDMSFVASLWKVVQVPSITARLAWGEEILPSGTRHDVCQRAAHAVSELTGLPSAVERRPAAQQTATQQRATP